MVEILKVNPRNPDPEMIWKAQKLISEGKLVIFPTDTVYGLATDPFNENAVIHLLKVKQRDADKGLPVLVANLDMVRELVQLSQVALSFASKFWPGALTLILPIKKDISKFVTGYRNSLGIRIPNLTVTKRLAEIPIIGTSANISGQKSPITAKEAIGQLGVSVDLVLDCGPAREGLPSTIIDLTGKTPKLIREGPITLENLDPFLF